MVINLAEEQLLHDREIKSNHRQVRDWFILRFGKMPEHDAGYYSEWKLRFKNKYAWNRMDLESRKKWLKVEDAYNKKKKLKEVI